LLWAHVELVAQRGPAEADKGETACLGVGRLASDSHQQAGAANVPSTITSSQYIGAHRVPRGPRRPARDGKAASAAGEEARIQGLSENPAVDRADTERGAAGQFVAGRFSSRARAATARP
jgi:hypothetical protein